MALLESISIPLKSKLPEFSLPDALGKTYKSSELVREKGLLLIVTCNHCPYAKAVWPRSIRLAEWGREKNINTAAINPNIHPDYPDDSVDAMAERVNEWGIHFPYLVDEDQQVARMLQAQCTPDIYLYNGQAELVYHGRIDDNWQDESKVKSEELKNAMQNLADGTPIAEKQYPSMGCSIKWK